MTLYIIVDKNNEEVSRSETKPDKSGFCKHPTNGNFYKKMGDPRCISDIPIVKPKIYTSRPATPNNLPMIKDCSDYRDKHHKEDIISILTYKTLTQNTKVICLTGVYKESGNIYIPGMTMCGYKMTACRLVQIFLKRNVIKIWETDNQTKIPNTVVKGFFIDD